jgi:dihydrofolate reductase/thymidylate synthase
MFYNLIALRDEANLIGYNNDLIYKIKEDMLRFKKITSTAPENKINAVIMGYNTWGSIPDKYKPLSDRLNIILTNNNFSLLNSQYKDNTCVMIRNNFGALLNELEKKENIHEVFIIGGGSIFQEAIKFGNIKKIYLTEVKSTIINKIDFISDVTYFPYLNLNEFTLENIDENKSIISHEVSVSDNHKLYNLLTNINSDDEDEKPPIHKWIVKYTYDTYISNKFIEYEKTQIQIQNQKQNQKQQDVYINHEEKQYLNLLKEVITAGHKRQTRNAITYSTFAKRMEFDLSDGKIPVLTTKRVAIKTCTKELLWFINGDTNNKTLSEQNVHIWDGNSSREFLDSIGLIDREEGDLGPVYGFQWRHSGAKYTTCHDDYTGQGIDQLKNCIELLKNDPHSRRNILCAWNPSDLKSMALPPCHVMFQFYVEEGNKLSLQMYQRSGDSFLGIPFNIFSYSLLVHMVAHTCGLKTGRFIHIIGDFHAYEQHIDAINEQLSREPYKFPHVKFNREISDIDDFKLNDIEIIDYKCYPTIKSPMIA